MSPTYPLYTYLLNQIQQLRTTYALGDHFSHILVLSSFSCCCIADIRGFQPLLGNSNPCWGWVQYRWSAWCSTVDASGRNASHQYTLWRLPIDPASLGCVVPERKLVARLGRYKIHAHCEQSTSNLPAIQLLVCGVMIGIASCTYVNSMCS